MHHQVDVSRVKAVLLSDGWHKVAGNSFTLEPHLVSWRSGEREAVWQAGFAFMGEDGHLIAGPLASIIALKSLQNSP
jgi:hypothetical protein